MESEPPPCKCQLCEMYYGDQAPSQDELRIAVLEAENAKLKSQLGELEQDLKAYADSRAE